MTGGFLPLAMGEEARLLTAIVLGGLFGFALERGGFGNARKLAAQFYLYDMTVFKVMFTAILTAMTGLYTLHALGWFDLALFWINPTFVWAQVVGGFLLGVGFIMSGLCPGTSVVSAASGRVDALVTFAGIFVGTLLFAVAVDLFPPLLRLYESGSLGVSTLHGLLGVPAPWLALGVVAMALLAFGGAEKVERIFQARHRAIELTPPPQPRIKLGLAAAFGVVAVVGGLALSPAPDLPPLRMATLDPLSLAEAIIAKDPNVIVVDVRAPASAPTDAAAAAGEVRIPGAFAVAPDSTALAVLGGAVPGVRVVVVDGDGSIAEVPADWPRALEYVRLRDGLEGWRRDVLTPVAESSPDLAGRDRDARRNQVAAFFSGATVQTTTTAAPPPAMGGGGAKKKKAGGC